MKFIVVSVKSSEDPGIVCGKAVIESSKVSIVRELGEGVSDKFSEESVERTVPVIGPVVKGNDSHRVMTDARADSFATGLDTELA